jgi:arabinogalactan endo-1,4-beta-galactosidase
VRRQSEAPTPLCLAHAKTQRFSAAKPTTMRSTQTFLSFCTISYAFTQSLFRLFGYSFAGLVLNVFASWREKVCAASRLQKRRRRFALPAHSILVQLAALLALFPVVGLQSFAGDFLAGADMSHLAFFESRGVLYKNAGHTQDALTILRQHGLTCARLRLFTSNAAQAQADPYNYVNNLDYTVPLALRVKAAGLQFLLDFHYSDTWADPGHQRKPAAWTNLAFPRLVQQMREYNSNSIAAFKAAGAMPDCVQVGNEITGGMLWPDGRVGGTYDTPAQWAQLGALMNAAVQGIQDASGPSPPKIIVHIDRGGDWAGTQWFFNNLNGQNVPYDIIGESYYPFWHGPLSSLATCLTNAAQRFHKPVMVVETAFPWTNSVWSSPIIGITPSVDGQVQYVGALAGLVERLPGGVTGGAFWWGTEYRKVAGVNGAGFDTASFFGSDGNVLPVADALGQLALPFQLVANIKGPMLLLNWPLSGAGSSLMVAPNFPASAAWSALTNVPNVSSTGFSLSLPLESGPCRFYKLQ